MEAKLVVIVIYESLRSLDRAIDVPLHLATSDRGLLPNAVNVPGHGYRGDHRLRHQYQISQMRSHCWLDPRSHRRTFAAPQS